MYRALIIATVVFVLGVAGFAQVGPMGPMGQVGTQRERPDPVAGVQQALNLNATQVSALQAILTQRMEAVQAAHENIRAKQEALRTLQRQQSPDATALGAAMQALQEAQQQLTAIHEKFLLDFETTLNAEQKKVLADTRAAADRIQALARLGLVGGGPEFGGPGGPDGPGGRGFGRGPGGPGGPEGAPGIRGQRGGPRPQ